jgi:hypothetical protein
MPIVPVAPPHGPHLTRRDISLVDLRARGLVELLLYYLNSTLELLSANRAWCNRVGSNGIGIRSRAEHQATAEREQSAKRLGQRTSVGVFFFLAGFEIHKSSFSTEAGWDLEFVRGFLRDLLPVGLHFGAKLILSNKQSPFVRFGVYVEKGLSGFALL